MRVTFVRGPRRVVPASSSLSGARVVGLRVEGRRVEVCDDDVVSLGLMSVVTGGLVLVIVAVVVGADDLLVVAEKDGSTKFAGGASPGPPDCRITAITTVTSRAITATPAALAASRVEVRLCQGVRLLGAWRVTGSP